ncbi:MAG: hypothetical protein Q8R38_04225 [Candidatus Omnitrophota bacterium]|nr:hypothetical protein [Candidatus Omnitrophota bacterium]
MTKTDKEIFTEIYNYKRFNFVIKVILKEQSLEIEGIDGDNSITSAKVYFNPLAATNNKISHHLLSDPGKGILNDVKESLRIYADYGKGNNKNRLRRRKFQSPRVGNNAEMLSNKKYR